MKYKDFFKEDILPGGKGDNKPDKNFDPEELNMGIAVEAEHTKDKKIAKEIAKDHLSEDPHYYSKLKKCGLADELTDKKSTKNEVLIGIDNGEKQIDTIGCIEKDVKTGGIESKTPVDKPATDPTPTDHVTGGMSTTPSNPNILDKNKGSDEPLLNPVIPKDIDISIAEAKKLLNKMKKEGFVPAAGDPDKDKAYVKGKRWTVKWK